MSSQSRASFKRIKRDDLKFVNDFTRLKIKSHNCRNSKEAIDLDLKLDPTKNTKKHVDFNINKTEKIKQVKLENGFTFNFI